MLKNKTLLITGGTGSLGKALTAYILEHHSDIKKLVIYSRDEQKQFVMAQEFPSDKYPQMRFLIGDVRDKDRLTRAFKDVDFCIQDHDQIKLYQVSYQIENNKTQQREIRSLEEAMKELQTSIALIITYNQFETIKTHSGNIEVIPFWYFVTQYSSTSTRK